MKKINLLVALWLFCIAPIAAQNLPNLQVSSDGHYLQTVEGKPFFYLGDTAWELFHRLNRGEALDWVLVIDDATKKYPTPGKELK